MDKRTRNATGCAVGAAILYALNAPLSKLLLSEVPVTMMAALLYLGSGTGLLLYGLAQKYLGGPRTEGRLTRTELPYAVAMVVLDVIAPIFLLVGLSRTTAANVSLLNNFEIVATAIIARLVFGEAISRRLAFAIGLVTVASMLLSFEDIGSLSFSVGSVFVLLACGCWGIENNCTRKISGKDPIQIVTINGLGSGLGSLAIALTIGERLPSPRFVFSSMLLGFFAYGVSVVLYVFAQRHLGAAKTSTYYAIAPFAGVVFSTLIFRHLPSGIFFVALALMLVGAAFAATDDPDLANGQISASPRKGTEKETVMDRA